VDKSLRDLLDSDEPFGGIPLVVGGDFRQQAPVVLRGNRVDVVEACVKSSPLWPRFQQLDLSQNMRVRAEETAFCDWLLAVGSGTHNGVGDFVALEDDLMTGDIVSSIFGPNVADLPSDEVASRAILCPKNSDTLMVNERILSSLPGESTTYYRFV